MVIEDGKRSMILDCKYGAKHYIVYVPELHFQRVLILATSSDEAKELVREGEGEYKGNEYKRTLEEDEIECESAWQVELALI